MYQTSIGGGTGGQAGFQADYQNTDAQGVKYYDVISANDGYGPNTMRVLAPTNPAPGVAHNFLIVLPVEAGLGTTYGDGLATLQALDAQDKYDLTIIEPSFADQSLVCEQFNCRGLSVRNIHDPGTSPLDKAEPGNYWP